MQRRNRPINWRSGDLRVVPDFQIAPVRPPLSRKPLVGYKGKSVGFCRSAEEFKESGYTTVSEVLRNLTANGQGTLSAHRPHTGHSYNSVGFLLRSEKSPSVEKITGCSPRAYVA
jgi:hypothetical protein